MHIYTAGFPCQPFSMAGERRGMQDPRGNVFFGCAAYIAAKRPWLFILENVMGLLSHDGGRTFEIVLETLLGI